MQKIKKYITLITIILIAAASFAFLTACQDKAPDTETRLVDSKKIYYIDMLGSRVKGLPIAMALDGGESYLALYPDGKATFRLLVNDGISSSVGSLLGEEKLEDVDISIILNMLYEYLPGLDLSDLSKTLEVFEGGLRIKLLGINPSDPQMQEMFAYMGEHGTLPPKLTIPQGFGIEINTTYYIKDVKSEHTGKTYTGIYMGNHHPDGEAFFMAELTKDSQDNPLVIMDYELMDIKILLK